MFTLLLACTGEVPGDTDTDDTDTVPFDGWEWCPSADDAVTSGDLSIEVTSSAEYCAMASGSTLAEELAAHRMLRVIPGTYAWPGEAGTVDYTLPVCLLGPDVSVPSALGEAGELELVEGSSYQSWFLQQPLVYGGEEKVFALTLNAYHPIDDLPVLIMDDSMVHGDYPDTDLQLRLCDGTCDGEVTGFYPCAPSVPTEEPRLTLSFDRGSLSVWVEEVPGTYGPSVPAVFYRAEGVLNGTAFSQTDYWSLAHIPDHHNRGGGFLVTFEAEIGGACGVTAEVPSDDGSYHFDELRAATIACDGTELEEMAGVVVE